MPQTKLFHILIKTGDINGKLAALGGKLLVHLPNYFLLHENAPAITDSIYQAFKVLIPENLIDYVNEGQGPQPRLWLGTKGQRHQLNDLVTVEIVAEHAIVDQSGNPQAIAAQAFAEFPRDVQIAAVLANAPDVAARIEAKTQGDINKWASDTLASFVAK